MYAIIVISKDHLVLNEELKPAKTWFGRWKQRRFLSKVMKCDHGLRRCDFEFHDCKDEAQFNIWLKMLELANLKWLASIEVPTR